jgi:putative membrane protein
LAALQKPYLFRNALDACKLAFVLALYFYHGFCHRIYKELQRDEIKYSPTKLRIFNEAPTVILFAVVFLVVLKNAINWIWGVVGIILFGVLLMIGIRFYKKIRAKKSWDKFEKELIEEDEKFNN